MSIPLPREKCGINFDYSWSFMDGLVLSARDRLAATVSIAGLTSSLSNAVIVAASASAVDLTSPPLIDPVDIQSLSITGFCFFDAWNVGVRLSG